MFKVIDNYLKSDEHLKLKSIMESDEFSWFYNSEKIRGDKGLFKSQFVHVFYKDDSVNSNFFNYLHPILKKLKVLSLIRVKANLNPISHKLIKFGKHVDQYHKCKGALYYLNDNNGYTMIGKNKVESKSNRIVLFDANQNHYGTNSTNCNNRIVINFNYF
jgi:hypothetical protein|tara:strand:+ start:45 stop:524 length:480 start_codon:yes stop_codon:yes gene_type:complete